VPLDDLQKAYLRRVMGDPQATRRRLRERKDEAADQVAAAGVTVPPAGAFGGQAVDPVAALNEYRQADNALDGLTKLERQREPTEDESRALTQIILKEGRPSLLVQYNSFKVPRVGEWTLLDEYKAGLEKIFPAVGRIEAPSEKLHSYFGTGFLVAQDVILTNRHVAKFLVQGGGSLSLRPDLQPRIDCAQEYQVDRFQVAAIKEALFLDEYWDLAALRLEWAEPGPAFAPLPLLGAPPTSLKDGQVVSVGYPTLDNRQSDSVAVQLQIFENIFEKKRFAPGYILGRSPFPSGGKEVQALEHDCSTLGGNSGSCVYSLDEQAVIGIHFAGVYLVANYAVPTWELADHPKLKSWGVQFK